MKTYLCFVLVMAAAPAMAADVTLSAADTMGQSSFNSGLHWSDGLPPAAGNNYRVNIAQLRTPADGASYTFAGDFLIIDPGGVFFYKGTGTAGSITIDNLIANGGTVLDHRNGTEDVCNLYGNIHIAADSVMYAKQGPINVYSALHGSGTITNPGSDGPDRTLTFYSNASTFTGSIVNDGRFVLADDAVLNFVIGAGGVNNSVSGVGPQTAFDGDFAFDLNGAGTTDGDTWQIANAAGQTFGSTFTVREFFDIGEGLWVTHHYNGTVYQFSEGTGQLSVFWSGRGTPEDPYQIWTSEQMNTIGLIPSTWAAGVCFKLMADIDMSAVTGTSYNIIGNFWSSPFYGDFDGNSHTVFNLVIDRPDIDYVGLFGVLGSGGRIYNLRVENAYINAYCGVGILCGYNGYGAITDCVAAGTVWGDQGVGGLVGSNYGAITTCYAAGTVSGNYAGGLVGFNPGNITDCNAAGTVSGNSYVGGLAGYNPGNITDCNAAGTVSGNYYVGGLVGDNSGAITFCYAAGTVSGNYYGGGLVGDNSGAITFCYAAGPVSGNQAVGGLVGYNDSGTITSCYAAGSVSGTYDVGGLVGLNNTGAITASFWDTQTSGLVDDSQGGIGKTTAQMQTVSTFTDAGWDFTAKDGDPADWRMPLSSYPKLGWEDYLPYCGDIDHPYPVGDFNLDCRVDLADYAMFAAQWLECTAPECD